MQDVDANKMKSNKKTPDTAQRDAPAATQEPVPSSPKETMEETVFNAKGKDNAEAMSFRYCILFLISRGFTLSEIKRLE